MDNRKYVQAQPFTLYGAGVSVGATSVILSSFALPDGTLLTMSNFGTKGYGTIEPGNGTKEEQISFTGVTQNANGTATLTGVKNVSFVSPYTETSGVTSSHVGGTTFVISNTSGFYDGFTNKYADETIEGLWDFPTGSNNPTIGSTYVAPTSDTQIATKRYVDEIATAGATYNAQVIAGVAGETLASGDSIYYKTSDQRWWKTDADASATSIGVKLGIAQGAATAGATVNVLTSGLTQNLSGLTPGSSYYLSGTAGALSTTAGAFGRFVGRAVSATNLYFDPSDGYVLTQQGSETYAVDAVGSDAYAITLVPPITAYQDGMVLRFKAGTTNTGASTLNVNSIGAKTIKKLYNVTLSDGDITAGQQIVVTYDASNDCFQLQSPISTSYNTIFGSGADGDVTIGANTSLTRDMYYNNLTVSQGFTLNPSGYRIFVKGTLTINGTVARNGNNGSNGSTSSGGAGGAALSNGTIYGGIAGIAGGNGGTVSGFGGSAITPTATTNAIGALTGSQGGQGGDGGSGAGGGGGGGSAAAASTATNPALMPYVIQWAVNMHTFTDATMAYMKATAQANGGAGGGAGSDNGGGSFAGGGGGGGGSSGGIVAIYARNIVISATGAITANGGNGGNGAAGTNNTSGGAGGGGGGGAGGNGGVILMVYSSLSNSGSLSVAGGSAGTFGAGGTTTGAGTNGTAGTAGSAGQTGVTYSLAV